MNVKIERVVLPVFTAALCLLVWHLAVRMSQTHIFPSPLEVARGLGELAAKGLLAGYIVDSLRRVAAGYLSAAVIGVPLGLLFGRFTNLGRAMNAPIQLLRPISPLAWMPLAVIWFGIGDAAPIFLIFMGAVFPILLATINASRNVPQMYMRAGENFGLSEAALLTRVVLPAILPRVLTGLRIALGVAWVVLVASEMIAVDSGLGYLIIDSRNAGKRYDLVVAGMLLIGLVGLLLDMIIRLFERLPMVRWAVSSNVPASR